MPQFSIIIPTYNRATLVFKTLESVLAQEFGDFEVLVVDDGSTDETPELFARFQHPKVSYFKKENAERGAARNFGASKAGGDYLTFFDSDDLMAVNHLAEAWKCIQAFGRPEVFALGFRIEDSSGNIKRLVKDLPDPLNDFLLKGNILGCNPVFVRADIFGRNPFGEARKLAGSEDWLLWLKLAARYPFRFWNQVTSSLIDHSERGSYHFKEESLMGRATEIVDGLAADPEFMKRYGSRLGEIRALRHIYTGLHLALLGQVRRPILYLARAGAEDPRSLFCRTTLGALKHILLNLVMPRNATNI